MNDTKPVASLCQNNDDTSNIGCIAGKATCSIGFAGRESVDLSFFGQTGGTAGTRPLQVNGLYPSDTNVLSLNYKLSRKLYLASVHGRTRRVALCIPPDDLEWAPAPGKFSFGDILRHLATIERYMYAETVHGRPSKYPGHERALADGYDATFAFYDRLHEESRELFGQLDAAALERKCTTPAGTPITTWKWLRAMFEHEAAISRW